MTRTSIVGGFRLHGLKDARYNYEVETLSGNNPVLIIDLQKNGIGIFRVLRSDEELNEHQFFLTSMKSILQKKEILAIFDSRLEDYRRFYKMNMLG